MKIKVNHILPPLNLRLKMMLVLSCYIVGILVMTFIAQTGLHTAKEKLETLELAYRLDAVILEMRRYEKNFLLYDTKEALLLNQGATVQALQLAYTIEEKAQRFKGFTILLDLEKSLLKYQKQMALLIDKYNENQRHEIPALAQSVRLSGQNINELSEKLVSFEHRQITTILQQLIQHHLFWSLGAILVGILVPLVLFFKIFRPLTIIKKATKDIAQGRFRAIEVVDTRDEMQQVMVALNTMVQELQVRQDQLVQSQKLSSIGTLSAGIAHQLNNPLNNISTSCQIAVDEFDSDNRAFLRQMLRNIEQETMRARDVVQGLLEFSREKEFALREENLYIVVRKAVSLVKSQVPASIELKVTVPEELFLPLDSQRMQEVLLNLIINASQAIVGSGSIEISATTSEENEQAVISVRDTGIGIPEEIQGRLFDPFFSTKDEGQGTGLGLSITYGIIQKHRGEISIQSSPENGTTFFITLPMRIAADRAEKMI